MVGEFQLMTADSFVVRADQQDCQFSFYRASMACIDLIRRSATTALLLIVVVDLWSHSIYQYHRWLPSKYHSILSK